LGERSGLIQFRRVTGSTLTADPANVSFQVEMVEHCAKQETYSEIGIQ